MRVWRLRAAQDVSHRCLGPRTAPTRPRLEDEDCRGRSLHAGRRPDPLDPWAPGSPPRPAPPGSGWSWQGLRTCVTDHSDSSSSGPGAGAEEQGSRVTPRSPVSEVSTTPGAGEEGPGGLKVSPRGCGCRFCDPGDVPENQILPRTPGPHQPSGNGTETLTTSRPVHRARSG